MEPFHSSSANTISSRIYNNRANSGGGGGIYILSEYGNLPIFISNSVLTNNTSGGINSVIHISNYTSLSVLSREFPGISVDNPLTEPC
ncbi:MAG: hypothetical protein RMJ37_02865 [Spirochaetia bacterium]|nr:hypothetical protein [Spirochaetota bacterium]MDW8112268.1 hypothetical protein [Spirochaetia bacterium]